MRPARDRRSAGERGYGHAWRKARAVFLQANPLCVMCAEEGRITTATVVDHIIPHKGDLELFWDRDNWQPLCAPHHSSDKAMLERSGRERVRFTPEGRVMWGRGR